MALPKKEILMPVRLTILIAAALVFAGLVYGSIASYRAVYHQPSTLNKQAAVYRYSHQGGFDYRVHLKPNSVFTDNTLGPGKSYFNKLLDYIDLNYSYLFQADQETLLQGTYTITATLEAQNMWQKDFVLVPSTPFTGKGKGVSFNKNYALNLTPYKDYLSMINREIGVSASEPKLIVKLAIDLKADSKAGSLRNSLAPMMVIPLTEGQFTINGNLTNKKSGSISKTVAVTNPALGQQKVRLIFMLISTIALGFLLTFLLTCTKGKPLPPRDEEVLIQKKYGTRLVRVPGEIQLSGHVTVLAFSSMDELVKAADELGKPIIKVNSAATGFVYYFVFDSQVVYKYFHTGEKNSLQNKSAGVSLSI